MKTKTSVGRLVAVLVLFTAVFFGIGTRAYAGNYPVWKTITVGDIKSADDFASRVFNDSLAFRKASLSAKTTGDEAVLSTECVADPEVRVLLDNTPFTVKGTLVLVTLTREQLGLPNEFTAADVRRHATALGLRLPPASLGPELRAQYPNQPDNGEVLVVLPEPISSRPFSAYCLVNQGGKLVLNSRINYQNPSAKWVFVQDATQ